MAYTVNVAPRQEQYIQALPLSEEARDIVWKFVRVAVGNVSDEYRIDPARRPRAGAPYFHMRLNLRDLWGDRRDHVIDFVVNDAAAQFGVLDLVWVDHQEAGPPGSPP